MRPGRSRAVTVQIIRISSVNAERLHAIANEIYEEMAEQNTPNRLTELRDALRQSVNEPGNADPQQQVSNLRRQLDDTLSDAPSNHFSPAWREALEEMGIAGLVGEDLGDRIEAIFERNKITPSAAADELDPVVDRIISLFAALENVRNGLSFLKIGAEELEPGEVEIGFIIPREAVKDELEELGKEFIKLQQILGPFLELTTGSREGLRVRTISSSAFAAFLDSAPAMGAMVATAVERLIAAYKNVLDIRESRQRLKEAGASDKTLKSAAADAESSMSTAIGTLVDELMREAAHVEQGRQNELRTELTVSLNAFANRIDRGYNVEVRVGELPPPPDEEDEDAEPESREDREKREIVERVHAKQESLKFSNAQGPPILALPEPKDPVDQSASQKAPRRRRPASSEH